MFKTDLIDGYDNPVWRLLVQEAPVKAGTFHKAANEKPAPEASPPAAQADFDDQIGF